MGIRHCQTCKRKPQRVRHRGSAALAAIVALAVVFVLVVGMLAIGQSALLTGNRELKLSGSYAAAMSGVEYGYWQVVCNGVAMPYSASRSLGDGTVSVTVTDNSANAAGTIKVVSTGAYRGDRRTVTKILATSGNYHTIFDYALATNSTLNTGQAVSTGSGTKGDSIFANGSIKLTNLLTLINGDAVATGSVSVLLCLGQRLASQPALPFPALDLAYYQTIAAQTYSTSQTFGNITFPSTNAVIYVNGDITLSGGTIRGTGTLVASNRIIFSGNTSYNLSGSDKLAGLALNGFSTTRNVSVVGIYYGHNATSTATLSTTSAFTIASGSMAVDVASLSNSASFHYDWGFTPTMAIEMHIPGY